MAKNVRSESDMGFYDEALEMNREMRDCGSSHFFIILTAHVLDMSVCVCVCMFVGCIFESTNCISITYDVMEAEL
jgi:hypothetical protein